VRLTRSKKILATGAAVFGVMLGAAGIAAAATGSGGATHRSPAVHAQADHEQSDTTEHDATEHDAPGGDAGETEQHG
jgi:hypothetical protein